MIWSMEALDEGNHTTLRKDGAKIQEQVLNNLGLMIVEGTGLFKEEIALFQASYPTTTHSF